MTQTKVFKKKCPECGKEIASLHETQFNHNWEQHIKSHKKKDEEDD